MLKATVPGSGGGSHAKLDRGLTGTIGSATSANDAPILHHFHPPRVGAPARGTSEKVVGFDRYPTQPLQIAEWLGLIPYADP